jgi:hypothetical protein
MVTILRLKTNFGSPPEGKRSNRFCTIFTAGKIWQCPGGKVTLEAALKAEL